MRSYRTATGTQTSADSKPRCHVGNSTGERNSDDATKNSMHFDCCSVFSKATMTPQKLLLLLQAVSHRINNGRKRPG